MISILLAAYNGGAAYLDDDWTVTDGDYASYLWQITQDQDATNGDYADVWAERDYSLDSSKIGCSALIVHGIAHMKPGEDNGVANYAYYHECFGDLETVETRDCNPEVLAHRLKAAGKKLPDIYMACGTEDFLIENNRAMHRFLEKEKIAHEYHEGKGVHDMVFWSEYIAKAIDWMFTGK